MRTKVLFLSVVVLLVASLSATAQSGGSRGFFFQGGLGFAGISYPDDYDAALNELEAIPGVDRLRLNLHLGVGYGLVGSWYGSFLLDAYGDRLDDGFNYIQTNTYLYGFGIQGYPLGQGLMLGAHVGPAGIIFDSDFLVAETSDWGTGFSLMAGYDLVPTDDGPGVLIGFRLGGASIEDDSVGFATLFASFLYK